MVVQDKSASQSSLPPTFRISINCSPVPLDKIPYIDNPELRFNEHESTEMPFRYVKGEDGMPVMPEVKPCSLSSLVWSSANVSQGMFELIQKDADRGIDDLL
jgi:Uncharacterized conserved protein